MSWLRPPENGIELSLSTPSVRWRLQFRSMRRRLEIFSNNFFFSPSHHIYSVGPPTLELSIKHRAVRHDPHEPHRLIADAEACVMFCLRKIPTHLWNNHAGDCSSVG